jgi:hypothetical protein
MYATAVECAQPAPPSNTFNFHYDPKGQNVVLIVSFDHTEVEWGLDAANHILAKRWPNETVEKFTARVVQHLHKLDEKQYKRGDAILPHFVLLSSGDPQQYGRRPQ